MSDDDHLTATEEKAFRSRVTESLNVYSDVSNEFRKRLAEWLIEGDDASCLLEFPEQLRDKPKKSFFRTQHHFAFVPNEADRLKLRQLLSLTVAPKDYWRRLGAFAEAIPELQQCSMARHPDLPAWFQALNRMQIVLQTRSGRMTYYLAGQSNDVRVDDWVAVLMDEIGHERVLSLLTEPNSFSYNHIATHLRQTGVWKPVLEKHAGFFSEILRTAEKPIQQALVNWLLQAEVSAEPFVDALAELAITGNKAIRTAALKLLQDCPQTSAASVAEWLRNGSAGQRGTAVDVLVSLLGNDASDLLREALKSEKGKRVRQSIETALMMFDQTAAEESGPDEAGSPCEFPPVEMPTGVLPLPEGFEEAFLGELKRIHQKLHAEYERQSDLYNSPEKPQWMGKPSPPDAVDEEQVRQAVQFIEGRIQACPRISQVQRATGHHMNNFAWAHIQRLHLLHIIRLMQYLDWISIVHGGRIWIQREDLLQAHRTSQAQPYGLRELDAALSALPPFCNANIGHTWLRWNGSYGTFLDWEDDAIWPFFAEHAHLLRDALHDADDHGGAVRRTAIRVTRMMPQLPADIQMLLWGVALGEAKSDRPAARAALIHLPGAGDRALGALTDGRQAIRIAAAEMLRDIGDAGAVEPLKKVLRKEKQEIVKGAMLQAIEVLGGDVEEFLGRRKQLNDAEKGLEKKRPKGMEWVPLDGLPEVHWADDHTRVAPEIVQWWVVQSIQFKLSSPGALLKRVLQMCHRSDTARLATSVLASWISYDTQTMDHETAVAEATKRAASQWKSGHKWLMEYYKSEERLRSTILAEIENTFLQSAIGQKGMLAIVAAAGDVQSVRMCERYIRKYHGHRLAQCKALLDVLAWIDDPTAVQVLLSISNRFRTKGIRKHATELVTELAERQGWTMDELADRSIPDAGFVRETDEDGNPVGERAELILDYGSRTFTVILGDDLQPVITREDRKAVKSLPAAAKDDDPELVKAAKKEFSAAKSTVRETVRSLAERFYEAACVQRTWPAGEWKRFLADHPIAGALCRRVIWAAAGSEEDESLRLFRPLEDGTLTDVDDNEFHLQEGDIIRVAHSSVLDSETEAAWRQHLQDYEVPELFRQFGRETYRLPENMQTETDVTDFRGHMLTTFQLRGKAARLGWVRGDVEDGGSFCLYYKSFPSLRMNAVLEFSGSYVPEEDIPAALKELYFNRQKSEHESATSWNPSKLPLSAVPPVLLSESYNDVRDIAAAGSGFDAEWTKKGLW